MTGAKSYRERSVGERRRFDVSGRGITTAAGPRGCVIIVLLGGRVQEVAAIRPSVLFITCHLPYPPVSGGRRRDYEILRRVARHCDCHVCLTTKTYDDDLRSVPVFASECASLHVFPKEPVQGSGRDLSVCRQVADNRCPALSRRIADLLESVPIDLVHVEGFYLMQHVPENVGLPLLLVEQNVEYALWRQRAGTSHGAEREAFIREYLLTVDEEIRQWRRADLVGALTDEDAHAMREAVPELEIAILPDGADHLMAPPTERDAPSEVTVAAGTNVCAFIANFAYQPNADAARHLCERILPRIRGRHPDVRVFLVGNSPPPEVRALAGPNVVVTGTVPAVDPYLDAADVVVCPLRIGGGIKVKVLEALARGKPVVTTSIGVQGLPAAAGEAAVVVDDPADFADAVVALLGDPERREWLSRRALAFAREQPIWDDAAAAVLATYRAVLSGEHSVERIRAAAAAASRDVVLPIEETSAPSGQAAYRAAGRSAKRSF